MNDDYTLGQGYEDEEPSTLQKVMKTLSEKMMRAAAGGGNRMAYAMLPEQQALQERELGLKEEGLDLQRQALNMKKKEAQQKPVGKILPETAVMKISDYDRGVRELELLGNKIEEQSSLVGAVTGWRKLNPWAEESRSLQADIDRVKQLVGKALEGGVLRKEDEEKYKKILAQITDQPKVAQHKIKEILRDISKSRKDYLDNLSYAGYATSGFAEPQQDKKVVVSNGLETLRIPISDLKEAQNEGFKVVQNGMER